MLVPWPGSYTSLEIVLQYAIDFCIISKNEKNSHLIHFTSAHHKKYKIGKEAEKRFINTKYKNIFHWSENSGIFCFRSMQFANIYTLKGSVVDPFHFDTDPDPDPRIRFRLLLIRIRIRILAESWQKFKVWKFLSFFLKKNFVDFLCLSKSAWNTQILEHLEEI